VGLRHYYVLSVAIVRRSHRDQELSPPDWASSIRISVYPAIILAGCYGGSGPGVLANISWRTRADVSVAPTLFLLVADPGRPGCQRLLDLSEIGLPSAFKRKPGLARAIGRARPRGGRGPARPSSESKSRRGERQRAPPAVQPLTAPRRTSKRTQQDRRLHFLAPRMRSPGPMHRMMPQYQRVLGTSELAAAQAPTSDASPRLVDRGRSGHSGNGRARAR